MLLKLHDPGRDPYYSPCLARNLSAPAAHSGQPRTRGHARALGFHLAPAHSGSPCLCRSLRPCDLVQSRPAPRLQRWLVSALYCSLHPHCPPPHLRHTAGCPARSKREQRGPWQDLGSYFHSFICLSNHLAHQPEVNSCTNIC